MTWRKSITAPHDGTPILAVWDWKGSYTAWGVIRFKDGDWHEDDEPVNDLFIWKPLPRLPRTSAVQVTK